VKAGRKPDQHFGNGRSNRFTQFTTAAPDIEPYAQADPAL
jgi:hypothetical protein